MKWYLILLLFVITSCNLFETRSPEEPEQSPVVFFQATTPEQLIQNFLNSIKYKRTQNYADCFDKNFTFSPAQDAFAIYQSIFAQWNYKNELRYFQAFVSSVNRENLISVKLENKKLNFSSSDSLVYIADYNLSYQPAQSVDLEQYSGKIQLTLIQGNDGIYKILRWADFQSKKDTLLPTWSILKARFYN